MPETTAVRERPILFSAPMVQAILADRKTVTRRVIKPQPNPEWVQEVERLEAAGYTAVVTPAGKSCPYGVVGDRLWVRETFWTDRREPGVVVFDATPEWGKYRDTGEVVRSTYFGDKLVSREDARRAMLPKFWTKRPSIFMPRWASRITLEVTEVRVERLQKLTGSDAEAEGADCRTDLSWEGTTDVPDFYGKGFIAGFAELWDKLNAGRGFGWESNPWTFVVRFRRLTDA